MLTPKSSEHIFDEWTDAMLRKGGRQKDANKRANIAFPEALVTNYSGLKVV